MVVNGRPLKRAKQRRVTADLLDFLTFPDGTTAPARAADGPFRVSVREFLAQHARLLPLPSILSPPAAASPPHLLTWRVAFRVGDDADPAAGVELNVVEEDVLRSRSIYCDQCRVVGWSGHPVCCKRYHFIIQNDSNQSTSCRQTCCVRCGTPQPVSEPRCLVCKFEMAGDELEDWGYLQLEDTSHLLHAVVHANGYGHLLRVNGHEGGSKHLTGSDIMGFWDRLCTMLHVRKVTVMDISKKYGMEYRLLHAVTSGHSWYGEWGYQFGAGSYALTAESYQKAVEDLAGIPISLFFSHSRSPRTQLQDTIALYWSLSDRQIVTVRDLFRYLTHLLHEAHGSSARSKSTVEPMDAASKAVCAWTEEEVQHAENSMIKVLRAVRDSRWVSWRSLRGATSKAIEPSQLLDYCLKGLAGKSTDDCLVVAVRCNAAANAIEYRLERAASDQPSLGRGSFGPSVDHLLRDLKTLYNALLNPATMKSYKLHMVRPSALSSAAKILDCKQFTRHYDEVAFNLPPLNPFVLLVRCHVELVDDHPNDYTPPPPEFLILPETATVADLKMLATRAFQETYLVFQRFQAEQLLGFESAGDVAPAKLVLSSARVVRIRGRCMGDYRRLGQFRMERGLENWTVDCVCGAKDDDGERMLACDACGVWQHTRCSGISDREEVPMKFVCRKCTGLRRGQGGGRKGGGRLQGAFPGGGKCGDGVEQSVATATAVDIKGGGGGGGGLQGASGRRCNDEMALPIVDGRYGRLTTVG